MKTLIIDGHNSAWRLANRLPILTANGKPIQVVYGLLTMVHGLIERFTPDVAIICWDMGHSAYRKSKYPPYKANRHQFKSKHEEREHHSTERQIEEGKRILRKLNISQLYYPQTEADDLMAMVCQERHLNGRRILVSSDMDMLQLINEDTDVWSPIKLELYTHGNFRQRTGLTPQQFLQMRAVIGDKSDNIPGIAKGLGETTIRELLASYRDMDTLLSPKTEKKIYNKGNRYRLLYGEGVRQAYYRNLMLIDLSVCSFNHPEEKKVRKTVLEAVQRREKINKAELKEYFIEHSFASLLRDFGKWVQPFENLDIK